MSTWKKVLLEGDTIPSSDVEAGALGTGSYDIDGAVAVDTVNEHTSDAGVTVDGVVLRDGGVSPSSGSDPLVLANGAWVKAMNNAGTALVNVIRLSEDDEVEVGAGFSGGGSAYADVISEYTPDAGVTVDGVLLKDGAVGVDSIGEKTPDAGVTVEGVLLKDGAVEVDAIAEKTADNGVVVDGVVLKDSGVTASVASVDIISEASADHGVVVEEVTIKDRTIAVDSIAEQTADAGVAVEGVLLKDGAIAVDSMGEGTVDAGVTVEGVLLKDGAVLADAIGEHTLDVGVTIDGVVLKDSSIGVSGHISLGNNAAGSGLIRMPNGQWVMARNAADDADVPLVCLDSQDRLLLYNGGLSIDGEAGRVQAWNLALAVGDPANTAQSGILALPNGHWIAARNSTDSDDVALLALDGTDKISLGNGLLKLDPTSGSLAVGSTPAAGGVIGIPNQGWIKARNAADAGDVNLARVNSADQIEFGTSTLIPELGSYWIGGTTGERLRLHHNTPHSYVDFASGDLVFRPNAVEKVRIESNGAVILQSSLTLGVDASSLSMYVPSGSAGVKFLDGTASKALRVSSGHFQILDHAYGNVRFDMDDSGNLLTHGTLYVGTNVNSSSVRIGNSGAGNNQLLFGDGNHEIVTYADHMYFDTWTGNFYWRNSSTSFATEMALTSTSMLMLDKRSNTDNAMEWRQDNVAHGVTSRCATNAFGRMWQVSGSDGGLAIEGLRDTGNQYGGPMYVQGIAPSTTTARATNAGAYVMVCGARPNGTSIQDAASNENLFAVRNNVTTRFIIDAEGDYFYDGSGSSYDEIDDVQMVRAVDLHLGNPGVTQTDLDSWDGYGRDDLERRGIVRFNEDGHHFVSGKRLAALHNGAIWQLAQKVRNLTDRLAVAESRVAALAAA